MTFVRHNLLKVGKTVEVAKGVQHDGSDELARSEISHTGVGTEKCSVGALYHAGERVSFAKSSSNEKVA